MVITNNHELNILVNYFGIKTFSNNCLLHDLCEGCVTNFTISITSLFNTQKPSHSILPYKIQESPNLYTKNGKMGYCRLE
jgi:hypothetical protein